MSSLFSGTIDNVVKVIKRNVPQMETGGIVHCDEMILSTMFNVIDMTMNLVTCNHNYFTVHHPIYLLCCYVFTYVLLSFYIYRLEMMLQNIQQIDEIDKVLPCSIPNRVKCFSTKKDIEKRIWGINR